MFKDQDFKNTLSPVNKSTGAAISKLKRSLNFNFKKNNFKSGWGGRIRTLEWRDQNPLPYHLATPQEFRHNNDTLFLYFLSLSFLFFLCFNFSSLSAKSLAKFEILSLNKLISASTNLSALNAVLKVDNELIYAVNNRLFMNENEVASLNFLDENESFKVNRIYKDNGDIYIATSNGLIRNEQRIFTKAAVNDLLILKDKIYICSDIGLYALDRLSNQIKLYTKANLKILQCRASLKSKSKIYILSANGFYILNTKKNTLAKVNQGLVFNSASEIAGRFINLKISKLEHVYLALNNRVFKLDTDQKSWRLMSNKGLKFDVDASVAVLDLFYEYQHLFLVNSAGLFITELGFGAELKGWETFTSELLAKDENFLKGFTASTVNSSDNKIEILLGNFRGELYELVLTYAENLGVMNDPPVLPLPSIESVSSPEGNKVSFLENSINQDLALILSLDPSIQSLQTLALKFSGIPSGENFSKYKRQARLRNVLPQLDTNFDNSDYVLSSLETRGADAFDSGDSSINTSIDKNRKASSDNEFNTGFRFTWHLDRLIYDPEIVDIINSARVSANIRENLLTELTQIYFQRRNLIGDMLANPLLQTRANKFKLAELAADLDARTGGEFSSLLMKNLVNKPAAEIVFKKIMEI